MKAPETAKELVSQLIIIADRGIFTVHADEQIVLRTAARYIESLTDDAWHDCIADKPTHEGTYLCATIYPDHAGGYCCSQAIIPWRDHMWCCEDMIVVFWREKPPYPTGLKFTLK